MTTLELADHYAAKRGYSDKSERNAFVMAFVYGWNQRHDREPGKQPTDWPNAYGAGFWEGWHAKEKVQLQ